MLSILIPTYNYPVFSLVENLHNQLNKVAIEFEIVVLDDKSTDFVEENRKIINFGYCYFEQNFDNLGRTKTRQNLAERAKFDWLLFLDADVVPEKNDFIQKYLACFNNNQVVFGGYKYENIPPVASKSLRYYYGKNREEKSAVLRNKKPYEFVFSGNMLIKKELFSMLNRNNLQNIYGMDVFFSHRLWENKIPISHINNAIFHLGIEENEVFFNKVLESISFRKKMLADKIGIEKTNKLIAKYLMLKKWHLRSIVTIGFLITGSLLKKLIFARKPSLFFFDIYRLGYICKIK
ncbi:MAG: glycosyltransferase [Flavobacterium sp.]|nr:glycosyltransferase [Flavobacterium sp.]